MILFKIIPYHSLLGLDSTMRFLIISALFSLAVVGCSTEPVAEPVDTTPSSWELQAKKDAERDERRRNSIRKRKQVAEREIARAETAKLERLVWEAEAPQRAKVKRDTARLRKVTCDYLYQLLSFKDKDDFKFYGFGTAGPYNKWKVSIDAYHQSVPEEFGYAITIEEPIPYDLISAPVAISGLGLSLVFTGETERWQSRLAEVKKRIGYAEYLRNLKN